MKAILEARDTVSKDIEAMHKQAVMIAEKVDNYHRLAAEQEVLYQVAISKIGDLNDIHEVLDKAVIMRDEYIDDENSGELD